jgi:hypothetical protein
MYHPKDEIAGAQAALKEAGWTVERSYCEACWGHHHYEGGCFDCELTLGFCRTVHTRYNGLDLQVDYTKQGWKLKRRAWPLGGGPDERQEWEVERGGLLGAMLGEFRAFRPLTDAEYVRQRDEQERKRDEQRQKEMRAYYARITRLTNGWRYALRRMEGV